MPVFNTEKQHEYIPRTYNFPTSLHIKIMQRHIYGILQFKKEVRHNNVKYIQSLRFLGYIMENLIAYKKNLRQVDDREN